jgi:hypothetical protein
MNGVEGSPATRQVLFDALFQKGGRDAAAPPPGLPGDAIAGKARLEVDLTRETAFVLTHAVIGLLRAAAAEPDLALDPGGAGGRAGAADGGLCGGAGD